jgi:hypothetical protein
VDVHDVLEIWYARAFFSNQFPDPQVSTAVNADHLAHNVLTLQQEVQRLKKRA